MFTYCKKLADEFYYFWRYRKKAEGHVYKLKGKIDYAALMDPKFAEDEEDE